MRYFKLPSLIILLSVVVLTKASTIQALDASSGSDQGTSVIVDIQKSSKEVRSVITDRLIPTIQELSNDLKSDHAKAVEQHRHWQQTGSAEDAMTVNETIASALSRATTNLGNICELQQPVLTACETLKRDLEQGLEEYRSRAAECRVKANQFRNDGERASATMDSLVRSFGTYIKTGEQLPLEIDTLVRHLDLVLQQSEFRENLAESTERTLNRWLERCEGYGGILDRLSADYVLVFTAAKSHISIIGDVANSHNDVQNMMALSRQLEGISGDLLNAQSGFDAISNGLRDLFSISTDEAGGNIGVEAFNVDPNRGLNILSDWSRKESM